MILQSNYTSFTAPQFRRLSDDQLARLHHASLEILDRTGVCLYEEESLGLLKKAGVDVTDGNRVRIPPGLVEWALSIAPRRVVLCDRNGRRVLPLERGNVFYGPGSDCPYVMDHRTGERRLGTLRDIEETIRVCDALPNIDFLMSICVPSDVAQETADRLQMRAMLTNSTKPILFVTTEFEGCVDVVAMAEAVAGGAEALRRNPICALYINVTSPLRHNREALQKLMFMAGRGLPTTYTPVVLRGLNGPVTRAGATALCNAGELVGLVLAQLKREGTPIIISGGYMDVTDMRTMVGIYAAPENPVLRTELAHYYGLPTFGLAGASDAKLPDHQAAAEAAFTLMLEALCGGQLVHDVGYLESGRMNSVEQIVMCDEMLNYVKRFMAEVEISDETLALDVIDAVGPHGDFLGTKHTRNHYKSDWYPNLFDRNNYDNWLAAGGKDLRGRARNRIDAILAAHEPEPLPAGVLDALDAIVDGATLRREE
ncbi:MAG: trimethylamine methyltransferase family protein [Anaerolineae bacterium]|nr:trimethylamine methyltransferase family protein [Anaerolineae bacterium]